jgi:hypothetical protein
MLVRARESLGEEFRGITADGNVRPGLFPVRKTGVSLEPILRAARDFLATLDSRQQHQVSFDIQSDEWRSWSNVHPFLMRHGLGLHELAPAPREAALALVGSALSASGFETARNVMKLNDHACELTGLVEEYSEWYYWLSIFGTPSATEPWGWQLDGHHLIINCFILGDQLVLTPQFMGSSPYWRSRQVRRHAGVPGWSASVSDDAGTEPRQRGQGHHRHAPAGRAAHGRHNDNVRMPYEGIRYNDLTSEQRGATRSDRRLPASPASGPCGNPARGGVRSPARHALFLIGAHDDYGPFYYRIYSPVVLIEFDHQPGIIYANDEPTRDHIHTVVRTPNGNDYGKDLLRQHYARHDHFHPRSAHRLGKE